MWSSCRFKYEDEYIDDDAYDYNPSSSQRLREERKVYPEIILIVDNGETYILKTGNNHDIKYSTTNTTRGNNLAWKSLSEELEKYHKVLLAEVLEKRQDDKLYISCNGKTFEKLTKEINTKEIFSLNKYESNTGVSPHGTLKMSKSMFGTIKFVAHPK